MVLEEYGRARFGELFMVPVRGPVSVLGTSVKGPLVVSGRTRRVSSRDTGFVPRCLNVSQSFRVAASSFLICAIFRPWQQLWKLDLGVRGL